MSPLSFTTGVTPKEVADALVAVEKRLSKVEEQIAALSTTVGALSSSTTKHRQEFDALRSEMVKGDELRARLADLEAVSTDAFSAVERNTRAIRAVFTLLHPDDDHPEVTNDIVPNGVWLHNLVMGWIEEYGRIPVGEEH